MTQRNKLWALGLAAYRKEDYESAVMIFSRIISINSKSNSAYFNRALAYYQKKDYPKAKADLLLLYKRGIRSRKIMHFLSMLSHAPKEEEAKETQSDEDGLLKTISFFKSDTTFKDVIGMSQIKKYMQEHVIQALKNPELYKEYGKKLGDGVLMYGPSGVGKSYLCKAVAGEANANMIIMRIHQVMSMYVGSSEKNVNFIFKFAREHAPCIIFIDELDAIGGRRQSSIGDSKGEGSALRLVINELLTCMDGVEKNPEGIFVFGATNKPWDIDPALKRSGRFNNSLYIRPPNFMERKALVKYYLAGKKVGYIDSTKIALLTANYAQADIARICDISLLKPISEALRTGIKRQLQTSDIVNTIREEMPQSPLNQWFLDARGEVLGKVHMEMVDDAVHKSWKSGILEADEKIAYAPLIKDINSHTSSFGIAMTNLQKKLALVL